MTDYNDGKWHGWNGGECPVHSDSLVDVVTYIGGSYCDARASTWEWNSDYSPIVAFRVVKEHKEPREFWVTKMTLFDLNGNVYGYFYQECNEKDGQFKTREVIE